MVRLVKADGALGISVVGGLNKVCHPFGLSEPGIFISKVQTQQHRRRFSTNIYKVLFISEFAVVSSMPFQQNQTENEKKFPRLANVVCHVLSLTRIRRERKELIHIN